MKQKKALKLMITWCLCLLIAFIAIGFIHETLHGFLSWLDGRSVSTGFMTVGNPYTAPGDPDFRLGWKLPAYPYPMWLLASAGPTYATLLIAIIATFILMRFKKPSIGALFAGAAMVAGTIFYIIGGILIFINAVFRGVLHVEDMSIRGLVYAMYARGEDPSLLTLENLIGMPLNGLVFSGWFWLPIVIPFGIALVCYIIGSNKIEALFTPVLGKKRLQLRMTGLIFLTIAVYIPIVLWLDRVIRINW